jgi:hypothetical protein
MRTYWFMSEVLPTPLSPRMMTCARLVDWQRVGREPERALSITFLRDDIVLVFGVV